MNRENQSWVDVMNDNSFVNKVELMKWLSMSSAYELRSAIDNNGLPLPIYGTGRSGKMGNCTKWRVGDIREWLKTGKRVDGMACLSDRIKEGINAKKRICMALPGKNIPRRLQKKAYFETQCFRMKT